MNATDMPAPRRVSLVLVGLDGNAFALMGAWQRQARAEDWSHAEIKAVVDEAMRDDYDHLVTTLMAHCVNDGGA